MNNEFEYESSFIQAAGGLLWREHNGVTEIVVVHRRRYDDWTLPKGKLNTSESHRQAALREVLEETGYRAEIVGFAGAIAYETDKGPKVVQFWHMRPLDVAPSLDLDTEVEEVVWLTREQVITKLQYPLERALVQTLWEPGEQTPWETGTRMNR
jgi:8-oxo-dGTP diphosphatase